MRESLGFDLSIGAKELEGHLAKRVLFHKGRRAFYVEQAKKFSDDREKIENGHSNRRMGTHEEEIERSAKYHADTAKFLEFVMDHLPVVNKLPLSMSGLTTLELLE